MRVLCVTDFAVHGGYRWLWSHLPPNADEVEFCHPSTSPADRFGKWGKVLAYYPAYVRLGLQALRQTRANSFDVVLAFEGKCGLPYAYLRRLAGQRMPPLVVLFFSVKGVIMHFRRAARYGMRAVNRILVPSHREVGYYSRLLRYPEKRMLFCPIGEYDPGCYRPEAVDEGYIFAGGRSDRDYATFFRAVSELDCQSVVNTRSFALLGLRVPPNVRINDMMPLGALGETMAKARCVVAPLQNVQHAAGLSLIVLAMAAGRPVIATRAGGAEDYVTHGQNGLLVEPGDVAGMRDAIRYVLEHPSDAARMGREGRARYLLQHTFEQMATRVREALVDVCAEG